MLSYNSSLVSFLVSQSSTTYPYLGRICYPYNLLPERFTMLPIECRYATSPPWTKAFQNDFQLVYLKVLFQKSLKRRYGRVIGCFMACSFRVFVRSDLASGHGDDDFAFVIRYC